MSNDEEQHEEQKKLPVTKEDQRNMINDLKKFITESQGTTDQLGIFFSDVIETKAAETTLRDGLIDDAKIIMI